MYVREVVLSYRRRRGSRCPETLQPVSTPHRAAIIANELLNREPVEVFGILCLSTRQDLIAYHEVSRGSLDTTVVHPRDVFKAAILANSAGIVLVHNHPSGDPAPSADDLAITQRLKGAADLLGIELLDHVIVGHDGRYTSIRELGKL